MKKMEKLAEFQINKTVGEEVSNKKIGFHSEMFEETSYYFKNGLRWVYPYKFNFVAHVKGRWLNSSVLDVFRREFNMETEDYYIKAISTGKIKVNNNIVSHDHKLTAKDVLKTQIHRHEPPVIHEEIEFIQNNEEVVVINKPASIPVHPCGRFRHNTIVFILGKDYGLYNLHTIHRIDRLTSGVLMFAKTSKKARELEGLVRGRLVIKEYLARVIGDFPREEIVVDEPIKTVSHKIGFCTVSNDGKSSSTIFKKLSYNGESSVVRCVPKTGRMHQIRVHLQYLGYPIINDPIYNHPTAWGEGKGKKGTLIDTKKVMDELIRTRADFAECQDELTELQLKVTKRLSDDDISSCCSNKKQKKESIHITADHLLPLQTNMAELNTICLETNVIKETTIISKNDDHVLKEDNETLCKKNLDNLSKMYTSSDLGMEYFDAECTDCKRKWKEPSKDELSIFLHAVTYKGPGWEYTTKMPLWASSDWKF
uniref:Pseudouridine synthase n=1 Tax=Hydra vulgaris TaxID=6087 RepID=T2MAD7_HYDVU